MTFSVDPKADPTLASTMREMVARGQAFHDECKRRKVKFLPRQVMRPIYAKAGLADGALTKVKAYDFLTMPV